MIKFFSGLVCGVVIGIVFMAILAVSEDAEREWEDE